MCSCAIVYTTLEVIHSMVWGNFNTDKYKSLDYFVETIASLLLWMMPATKYWWLPWKPLERSYMDKDSMFLKSWIYFFKYTTMHIVVVYNFYWSHPRRTLINLDKSQLMIKTWWCHWELWSMSPHGKKDPLVILFFLSPSKSTNKKLATWLHLETRKYTPLWHLH